jgi:cytochrome c oxidase subunit II
MDVFVIGKQWMWHVQHANGVRENNTLHVPVGKPVRLIMISQDVIHAFYVPEFRMQFHVVPGRYTTTWFEATKPGRYKIFCGMYCGGKHSEMVGHVVVLPAAEYARWVEQGGQELPPMSMEEEGAKLFASFACANCHTGENTQRGPTLHGVFGSRRPQEDGTSPVADQLYLREAILRPHNRLTRGYGPTMPAYEGQLSESDVLSLIAHIRTLGAADQVEPTGVPLEPRRGSPSAATSPIDLGAGPRVGQTEPGTPDTPGRGN